MAGAPIGTFIGGELGARKAKEDKDRQEKYLRRIKSMYENMDMPTVDEMSVDFEGYRDPLLEQAILQGDTELSGINLDPATRDAQMAALARLEGIASQGGMDALDRARLSDIETNTARQARGARNAVTQNMAQRGMGGSGMELVAQLMANQDAASQANQAGLNVNAQAQQRALDAIMNSANLGGQIRGQDYGIASDRARAQDAINQFNALGRQGTQQRNIDRRNQTSIANTDLRNQQQAHNKGLQQQVFQNEMGRAAGLSGALTGLSGHYGNQAQATQERYAGYGRAYDQSIKDDEQTAASTAQSVGGMAAMFSDERLKHGISEIDPDDVKEFISAIKPKTYRYKDENKPGCLPGERIGFMLQDVQKTKLGRLITKTDSNGHLYCDRDNLVGILFAALAMGV